MGKRVTLQEIADALGMSRNTVSRALNNSGSVSSETRSKICQMATAMGYKQFSLVDTADTASSTLLALKDGKTEIALFTQAFPGSSHSGNKILDAFQHKIDAIGYKLSINIIRDYEINNLCFPTNINVDNIAGIICMELFSKEYCEFLCRQNIPLLFVDTPLSQRCSLNADVLYMENLSSVYHMLEAMINNGCKKIGFVGDRFHCQSFYERWQAIASLKELPDLFFCANDFLAMSMIKALRLLGKSVPGDIRICGFDDAPEANLIEPSLTTIKIHSSSMGYTAAELLLARISNPVMPYKKTYIETDIMYRESTSFK